MRITYALANRPKRLETTARNTQRPTRGALGSTSVLVGTSPCSAHGFSLSRCTSSHHAAIAVSIAITMAVIMGGYPPRPCLDGRRRGRVSRRLVLRDVVLAFAGHAVVVR